MRSKNASEMSNNYYIISLISNYRNKYNLASDNSSNGP